MGQLVPRAKSVEAGRELEQQLGEAGGGTWAPQRLCQHWRLLPLTFAVVQSLFLTGPAVLWPVLVAFLSTGKKQSTMGKASISP